MRITIALVGILVINFCFGQEIKLNQLGFYPEAPKTAIVPGSVQGVFHIQSQDGATTCFTDSLKTAKTWSYSGETVMIADFSEFKSPGGYIIQVDGIGSSEPFTITPDVHKALSKAALKGLFFQRASTAIAPEHGGDYARDLGHIDNQIIVHASAATTARPEGTIISGSKGWYDAGDFNKYIVNSGISTYSLLAAYESFPSYYDSLNININESSNDVPDILDEAKWNLDWMLSMQDPNDGGVYHKLTTAGFSGFVMPAEDLSNRYVVQKSTAATADFAAVMAVAYRVFQSLEAQFPGYADSCLTAAKTAWDWVESNPSVYYVQATINENFEPDIKTGEYGDNSIGDEKNWARIELYIATKEDSLYNDFSTNTFASTPSWQDVKALPWISLASNLKNLTPVADTALIKSRILSEATTLRNHQQSSGYQVPMGTRSWDFVWGSNGTAANQGISLLKAFQLSGDSSYLESAVASLDYLLGRNPTGYSFVSGFGDKTPKNFHHRISDADGIYEPIPGLIAGGPQPGQEDGCGGYPSDLAAGSYLDSKCSYSTNEIAINWNAPLVFLTGGIEHFYGSDANTPPIIIRQPESTAVQENTPAEFSIEVTGAGPFNYQWQFNNVDIASADSAIFAISNVQYADTGHYRVIITNSLGKDTSISATLSILVQGPFTGTPMSIPGVIELEDFDLGGQNLAYNDTDPGNRGGVYREEAVDLQQCLDEGGGYNIGWISEGEWLEYTVQVETAGSYYIKYRTASNTSKIGLIDVFMDETQLSNDIESPFTGNWQTYTSVYSEGAILDTGTQILRVHFDEGPLNINYIEFSLAPFDCHGDANGSAFIDSCGVCANGNTGVVAILKHEFCFIGLDEIKIEPAFIYPNPSNQEFKIDLEQIKNASKIEVYDAKGKRIETINTHSLTTNSFGKGYRSGLYQVLITANNKRYSIRVIKY